jgi:Ankyrin repeat
MSTLEGDVSAIQSGIMEPLPTYAKQEDEQSGLQHLLASLCSYHGVDQDTMKDMLESQGQAQAAATKAGAPKPIHQFPTVLLGQRPDKVTQVRQTIVRGFFEAISNEQDEVIALFINKGLVTPNTTAEDGKTPLLAAVATRNIRIVKELLDFGAEPDAWGVEVI